MLTTSSGMSGSGINRNILECKDRHLRQRYIHISVLIETYWNVKYIIEVVQAGRTVY